MKQNYDCGIYSDLLPLLGTGELHKNTEEWMRLHSSQCNCHKEHSIEDPLAQNDYDEHYSDKEPRFMLRLRKWVIGVLVLLMFTITVLAAFMYNAYINLNNEIMLSDANNVLNHIRLLIHATEDTNGAEAIAYLGENSFHSNPPFQQYDFAESAQRELQNIYRSVIRGHKSGNISAFQDINIELKEVFEVLGNQEKQRLYSNGNNTRAFKEIVDMLEQKFSQINSMFN